MQIGNESMAGLDVIDPETEVMAEFDFLSTEGGEGAGEARSGDAAEWGEYCRVSSAPTFSYILLYFCLHMIICYLNRSK